MPNCLSSFFSLPRNYRRAVDLRFRLDSHERSSIYNHVRRTFRRIFNIEVLTSDFDINRDFLSSLSLLTLTRRLPFRVKIVMGKRVGTSFVSLLESWTFEIKIYDLQLIVSANLCRDIYIEADITIRF